ncbi:hypothetical protein MPLDJ20_220090 [Mesorhizobium plurifarium]|uniref:Uncharacterized protein n=1 Tax=Mesorhizobium plurifarium TaxID=69974 RepID=A0A090F9H6_MESPL|nr:hypothetical protein MPLDJ20_220090 [Mesorhizobium plurifarium]
MARVRGFQTPTPKSSAFGGCAEIFRARDRACGCWHSCACRSHPGFRQEDYDRIVAELLPRQLLEWLALEEQVGVRNQMDIHSVPHASRSTYLFSLRRIQAAGGAFYLRQDELPFGATSVVRAPSRKDCRISLRGAMACFLNNAF